jgi:hypothetical protein
MLALLRYHRSYETIGKLATDEQAARAVSFEAKALNQPPAQLY